MKSKKKEIEIELNTFLNVGYYKRDSIEGIYYSNKTGRIFEAVQDKHGYVITRYCDDSSPEFGPAVSEEVFCLQFHLGIYEDVINYLYEGVL